MLNKSSTILILTLITLLNLNANTTDTALPETLQESLNIIQNLISQNKKQEASEYAEIVLNQPALIKSIQDFNTLSEIAIILDLEDAYIKISSDLSPDPKKRHPTYNHLPYFASHHLPNINQADHKSIIDTITSIIKVHPDYLSSFNTSKEALQEKISNQLFELSNKLTPVSPTQEAYLLLEILHVIAINAIKHPYQKIFIFDQDNSGRAGAYHQYTELKPVDIIGKDFKDDTFYGFLIHELTHKMMHLLFEDSPRPYPKNSSQKNYVTNYQKDSQAIYNKTKTLLWKNSNLFLSDPQLSQAAEALELLEFYEPEEHDAEFIVRLPQIITLGLYEHYQVNELYKPLMNYWNDFIRPEIQNYIRKNANYNKFISHQPHSFNLTSHLLLSERY